MMKRRSRSKAGTDKIEVLHLGDLLGENDKLGAALPVIQDQVNKDAPDTQTIRKMDLLSLVKEAPWKAIDSVKRSFEWVKERFTDYGIRKARQKKIEEEAFATRTDAESRKIEAQATATVLEAQAEKTRAETEAQRVQTRLMLLKKMKELGIDIGAKLSEDGSHLDIVVTKQISQDEHPSEKKQIPKKKSRSMRKRQQKEDI